MFLVIVEDLELDRERLAALIRQDCARLGESADLSFYASGEDFLERYRPNSCDGVFLDILLGGMSGIDAAKKIRETEPRLPIVFTTTEPDFALDSYSVHAMDYLVKPLSPEKVSWCLKELREYQAVPASITLSQISGRGHSAPVAVALDDILYGQYWDHSMSVHTPSGVYTARLSFQDFTALLPHTGRFYVCGRGLVVNLSQVARVGDGTLVLNNGDRLPFSRSRRRDVQKAYTEWAFARSRKGGWV